MSKVIQIAAYARRDQGASSSAQAAANKRAKIRAVLLRLRAEQNLAKIRHSENLTWPELTAILCEFIDWHRVACYVAGNLRAA